MNIYKYCTINENLFSSLREAYIWFSKPTTFNDPFDCKINGVPPSTQDLEELEDSYKFAKYLNKTPEIMSEMTYPELQNRFNSYGVSCFSKSNDNILMWSHYSEKHSGVCLEFNKDEMEMKIVSGGQTTSLEPIDVNYSEEYPMFDFFKAMRHNDSSEIEKALTTKSKDWEYESELRYISLKNGEQPFNIMALKKIYFGVKAPSGKIKDVVTLIKSLGYEHIEFYKMTLDSTTYSLNSEKLNYLVK